MARALVNRPAVLLLDEPLGALDLKLRKRLQLELTQIHRDVGTTFVYVTHDQEEAMSMATRIAVLNDGRIEQIGTPSEIYHRPTSRFVADFIGESNFLEVHGDGEASGVVRLADGRRVPVQAVQLERTREGNADGPAGVDPPVRPSAAARGARCAAASCRRRFSGARRASRSAATACPSRSRRHSSAGSAIAALDLTPGHGGVALVGRRTMLSLRQETTQRGGASDVSTNRRKARPGRDLLKAGAAGRSAST